MRRRRTILAKHYYVILYLMYEQDNYVDCCVKKDNRVLGYIIADNREQAIEKFNNREWLHY